MRMVKGKYVSSTAARRLDLSWQLLHDAYMGVHYTLFLCFWNFLLKFLKQKIQFVFVFKLHSNFFPGRGFPLAPAWNFSSITDQLSLGLKNKNPLAKYSFSLENENIQPHFPMGLLPSLPQVSVSSTQNDLLDSSCFPHVILLNSNQTSLSRYSLSPMTPLGAWETFMDICSTIGRKCSKFPVLRTTCPTKSGRHRSRTPSKPLRDGSLPPLPALLFSA